MRTNWRNQRRILNYITSNERFKIIFVMSIVLAVYGGVGLGISSGNYLDSILSCFTFNVFNVFIIALLFLNTLNTCSIFDKEFSFYTIRLENKRNYLKQVIKIVLLVNLFYFLIFFLLYFMALNIFNFGQLNIYKFMNYNVTNLTYMIFYMVRFIVISMIICSLSALIFINFKERIMIMFNFVFMAGFMVNFAYDANKTFSILPWHYYEIMRYPSFMTEISYSLLFIFILEVIYAIIYNFTIKNKRLVIS